MDSIPAYTSCMSITTGSSRLNQRFGTYPSQSLRINSIHNHFFPSLSNKTLLLTTYETSAPSTFEMYSIASANSTLFTAIALDHDAMTCTAGADI